MHIGIDARMIYYTGIGRHVYNLVTRISDIDRKNQYSIFVRPKDVNKVKELFENRENVSIVKTIDTIYGHAEQTTHLNIINKAKLDLLHVPHFNVPILYRGKLIVTIHDLIQAHFPSTSSPKAKIKKTGYKFIISSALKKAQKVIAVSNYTKQDIIGTFDTPKEKIQVIYNGVDERWKKVFFTPDKIEAILDHYQLQQPFLLYVGLSSPHKNLIRLIKAMHLACEQLGDQNLQLALVGQKDPRYLPDIKQTVSELGLEDKVIITGFVPDDDLLVLYNTAKAFIFPSLYEGFGLPPLEALHAGLPVLSSNSTCLPEILDYNATYFNPEDSNDMAQKVVDFISSAQPTPPPADPPHFSWDHMVRQTLELYRASQD